MASAGTIDGTGLFTAPKVEGPAVTVTATSKAVPSASASSKVALATALPQPKVLPGTTSVYPDLATHAMAASGARVYAVAPVDPTGPKPGVELFRSNDGGKTWSAPVTASPAMNAGSTADCTGVTIDPQNPDIVYVVFNFNAGSGLAPKLVPGVEEDQGLALAVSTDGGMTFPSVYALQTGNSADAIPVAQGICPDLAAPKPNAIVVETPGGSNVQSMFVFSDTNRGAGFSSVNSDTYNSIANEETGALNTIGADVAQDGGNGAGEEAPRLATDGNGKLCIVYVARTPKGSSGPDSSAWVQCSSDLGHTFTAPVTVGPKLLWGGDGQVSQAAVAIGPNKAVAVTWTSLGAMQPQNQAASLHVAHSADGGMTFTDVTPALSTDPLIIPPTTAIESDIRYDADGTLWVTYVGNNHSILVDKSCDGGTTWSGSVLVNALGGNLDPATLPGLVPTSTGMAVSANGDADTVRLYRMSP